MHKCSKCGTEFDGNFCPECGEKYAEDKTCPKCGATLIGSVKFCNECGYSFSERPAPAPATPQLTRGENSFATGTTKLYAVVSILPAVLFALFSILLFLFFLAPVAVMPGGEMLGQKIPSMSYGNVYAGSNYAGMSFKGSITALIVFAALALFVSCLIAVSCAFCKLRDMRFTVAGKKIFLRNILTAVGYILFFALFLISCILMGQIASAGGGLGLMKAGAAPILVLVFTLVGSLAALICAFVGAHLRKTYPAIVAATENRIAAAKPTKVEAWMKKHKVWTSVIAAVLVVAIVVGVAVPIGLANRHNGTYYAYNGETEEYDTTRYYKLTGGTWKNEAGETGKISFDGEKVTLTYDSSNGMDEASSSDETKEGMIVGDVLKVGEVVYAKEGHKHITDMCICACGHWILKVGLNQNGSYSIEGKGSFNGKNLIIPDKALVIGRSAFEKCSRLKSVTIPNSVNYIDEYAFFGCDKLTSVTIGNSVTRILYSAFSGCSRIKSVYYKDTPSWWRHINIEEGNSYLTDATRYYFSDRRPSEEQWQESENWWHYDENGEDIVIWSKTA